MGIKRSKQACIVCIYPKSHVTTKMEWLENCYFAGGQYRANENIASKRSQVKSSGTV